MIDDNYDRGSFQLDPKAKSFRMTGFRWYDAPVLLLSLVIAVCWQTGVNAFFSSGSSFLHQDTAPVIFGLTLGYLLGVCIGTFRSKASAHPQASDTWPQTLELSARVKAIADQPERFIEAIKVCREETGAGLAEAKAAVEAYVHRASQHK
jgi:hypothetical protein